MSGAGPVVDRSGAIDTMPMKMRPIFASPLLALVVVVGACAGMGAIREPPRVSVISIEPVDLQLLEQRYVITLRVQNPNDRAITIKGLDYEIRVNDEVFGRGVSNARVELPAYGEALAEVELVSTLSRLLRQFQALIERRTPSLDLAIDGGVSVEGIPGAIPFHFENQLVLPGTPGRTDRPATLSI